MKYMQGIVSFHVDDTRVLKINSEACGLKLSRKGKLLEGLVLMGPP